VVEVLHCDRCGNRLPISQAPDEPCAKCGNVQTPEVATRPPASGRHERSPTRGTPAPDGAESRREGRRGLPAAAGSSVAIFAVATVSGTLVAVALGLLLMGKAEAPAPASAGPPAPAPAAGIDTRAAPGPRLAAPAPAPPAPVPEAAPPPTPPKDDGDDFFAKLRAESETRRVKIGEAQAEKRRPFRERMERTVAKWDPAWKIVDCGDDVHFPGVNPCEHLGKRGVLVTHPLNRGTPCALERIVNVPADGRTEVVVIVAPSVRDRGADWELRILVDGKRIGKQAVPPGGGAASWRTFKFGLERFAGRKVKLRLENASGGPANPWKWEFGYWAEARVVTE